MSVKCKFQNKDLLDALTNYDKLGDEDHDELLDCCPKLNKRRYS